jgi:hypothetical protein
MLAPMSNPTEKGVSKMSKFTRVLAVAGISGALAVGGAGVASASTDRGQQVSPDKAQSAQRVDRSGNSRDKNGNSKDRGKGKGNSKDRGKGKHKHDHNKNHK